MTKVTAARVYMIFAAFLVLCAWKLSHSAQESLARAQANQASQLEQALGDAE